MRASSQQIVAAAAGDAAAGKFPDRGWLRKNHAGVDIGRVRFCPGQERLVDEKPQFASHFFVRHLACDPLLHDHGAAMTLVFYFRRNLLRHLRRARTFLLRVFENPEPVESRSLDEIEERLKSGIGFAWKSDDKRRA